MSHDINEFITQEYKFGFETDIMSDQAPPGLSEEIIRFISAKKRSRSGCCNGV